MENPSLEDVLALKRLELIDLACHLGVYIKKYFKKQQLVDEIIVNLVDNETLEEKQEKPEKKREQQKEKRREIVNLAYSAEHRISILLSADLSLIISTPS